MKKCEECGDFGNRRLIQGRRYGKLLCSRCYERRRYHDRAKYETCARCRKKRKVYGRLKSGKSICCYCQRKRKSEKCFLCANVRPVAVRKIDGTLCQACYKRLRHVHRCVCCKRQVPTKKRMPFNRQVCQACHDAGTPYKQNGPASE